MTKLPVSLPAQQQHQTFIDGLRGLAVVMVVLFHLNVPHLFPGGFVGVDIFFVLSGFLITRILSSELQTRGSVNLLEFATRRAARLLPVSALTVTAITIAGVVCLWPADLALLASDLRSASFNFANWHFQARSADYFDDKTANSLALHFWSLSVEEQFYVFWPLLHWGCGCAMPARRMSALLFAVLLVTFTSWFFSWFVSMTDVGVAYYSLASRGSWERAACWRCGNCVVLPQLPVCHPRAPVTLVQ